VFVTLTEVTVPLFKAVTVIFPEVVIGELETLIHVPAVIPTEVTVP
jgi:hypothetical protein